MRPWQEVAASIANCALTGCVSFAFGWIAHTVPPIILHDLAANVPGQWTLSWGIAARSGNINGSDVGFQTEDACRVAEGQKITMAVHMSGVAFTNCFFLGTR